MHLKRQKLINKIGVPRKGTKFVARALSNIRNSVPVLIAVRDMLGLAKTTREVKGMINEKSIKINGRIVRDYRESINLFNLLEVGKCYVLTLLQTGRFSLMETNDKIRLCKIVNKKILKNHKQQFNLHDGTNIVSNDKFSIGDSLYLDLDGQIKKHIRIDKGMECIVVKGKYLGLNGKISSLNGNWIEINIGDKKVVLNKENFLVK